MSIGVTNTNNNKIAFCQNAVKYLNNKSLEEASLGKQIVDGAKGSVVPAIIFSGAIPTIGALRYKRKNSVTFMEALKVKSGATSSAVAGTATKKCGKIATWFKGTALGKSKLATGLSKIGFGSMFGFNMLFQLMEIIPAFKNNGVGGGIKQVGKSVANASVDAVCYGVGMKLGATIGSSILPPFGTLVGGALGMVIGGALGAAGRALCNKVVGKNYSEEKEDKGTLAQAQALASDDEQLAQVKEAVEATVIAKAQSGKKLTEDDKRIYAEAQAIQVENTPEANDNNIESATNTQTTNDETNINNIQAATSTQTSNNVNEDSDEAILARLEKVDPNANLDINYSVPSNYSWAV